MNADWAERALAAMLLVCASPILLAAAVWIYVAAGRPILFRQKRVGRRGKPFVIYKLRTMAPGAQRTLTRWRKDKPTIWSEYEKNSFKLGDDPRLIAGGRYLRAHYIDEIPQLWNIVIGDMVFIGPRPLLAREISSYGENIHKYKENKPGLTGLWQVRQYRKKSFLSRSYLDHVYRDRKNGKIKMVIIFQSLCLMIFGRGRS